ncbi:HAMP domain-containing sensor histidine kinase [Actinocrinis sp.]|uniref:sensor histidine kinase n=1 Tax=Actinocrinis sp. TaxID=1920516 RepID=UPI002D748786|nr:HAMP domain-containing sensor histidine kinase [Actinocrinis sp.]HZP54852.1 HAMP domain-containing sensor histidine kinase [Actinocrinis sp.]
MTGPQPLPRRSLQTRLALAYAAGIYLAGVFVLVLVDVPLLSVQSTKPKGEPAPASVTGTGTGHGFSLQQLLTGSALALVILVPVSLALGRLVAGRFLRPLRTITSTAQHISAGNLHQRLGLGEPVDELSELGHTLDDLFARLQAAFDAQRHFVANASHELRTPLAGLRTLLEVALADPEADAATLRAVCEDALAVGAHQERLVQALLILATSEHGISRRQNLDLAEVAKGVIASRREEAEKHAVELTEKITPAITAGDPRLIESLVANLVDNAIRHNHCGGQAHITTEQSGPWVSITVTNTGPLVPDDQLRQLIHPFQRLAPGRHDGHGLGLAIINAVAQAHHAALAITSRPEGGLAVTVRFVPAPADD